MDRFSVTQAIQPKTNDGQPPACLQSGAGWGHAALLDRVIPNPGPVTACRSPRSGSVQALPLWSGVSVLGSKQIDKQPARRSRPDRPLRASPGMWASNTASWCSCSHSADSGGVRLPA
jgi:hypothetical protein